jgi:glycosyltransferase involved in cell wall biosynthesis
LRVLYLAPAGGLGGAERVLLDLLMALRQHGLHPQVLPAVLAFEAGPLIEELKRMGIPVWVVPLPPDLARLGEQTGSGWGLALRVLRSVERSSWSSIAFLRECRSRVAAYRPDLVHSNGLKAHLLARAICGSRPLLLHVHDFYAERMLTRHLLARVVGSPVTLIAVSQAIALDVARLFPEARIEVVHNAVDPHYFTPEAEDPSWLDALTALGPSQGSVLRVGLVATYARWKGHDVFLRAAAQLADWGQAARFRFYVVGSPIYATSGSQLTRADLEQRASELDVQDRVGFVDFQADIARVYRSLSVVVHASTGAEPFGRTIIEGMACAKPVLSTRTGGAAELFEHGVSGLEIAAGSPGSLAAALLRLADDEGLQSTLARHARERALLRFDLTGLSARLLQIYSSVSGYSSE